MDGHLGLNGETSGQRKQNGKHYFRRTKASVEFY
jgi:hypothetical protein